MNDITVFMALTDYIPVFMFFLGTLFLQRDLYNKMKIWQFGLLASGSAIVLIAGIYKATWKLLYALGVCDFTTMNTAFFPMQSPGFCLLFISLAMFLASVNEENRSIAESKEGKQSGAGKGAVQSNKSNKNGKSKSTKLASIAAPAVYSSNLVFIIVQTLSCLCFFTTLSVISLKLKSKWGVACFLVSGIGIVMMGYMGAKFDDTPLMNWIAQGCNIFCQGMFLLGVKTLRKHGLGKPDCLIVKA